MFRRRNLNNIFRSFLTWDSLIFYVWLSCVRVTGGIKMRECKKCNQLKELDEFYSHRHTCKKCQNNYRVVHLIKQKQDPIFYAKILEKYRIYGKKYRQKNKDKLCAMDKRRYKEHPEKRKATSIVRNAIKSGKLHRLPCEVCGTTKNVEGHHEEPPENI